MNPSEYCLANHLYGDSNPTLRFCKFCRKAMCEQCYDNHLVTCTTHAHSENEEANLAIHSMPPKKKLKKNEDPNSKATTDKPLYSYVNGGQNKQYLKCSIHHMDAMYFCSSHCHLICQQCHETRHNTCDVKTVTETCKILGHTSVGEYRKWLNKLRVDSIQVKSMLSKNVTGLETQKDSALKELESEYLKVTDRFNAEFDEAKSDITDRFDKFNVELCAYICHLNALITRLDTSLHDSRILEGRNLDFDLFVKLQNILFENLDLPSDLENLYKKLSKTKLTFKSNKRFQPLSPNSKLGCVSVTTTKLKIDTLPELRFPVTLPKSVDNQSQSALKQLGPCLVQTTTNTLNAKLASQETTGQVLFVAMPDQQMNCDVGSHTARSGENAVPQGNQPVGVRGKSIFGETELARNDCEVTDLRQCNALTRNTERHIAEPMAVAYGPSMSGQNIMSKNNEWINSKNIVRNDNGESLAGNMGPTAVTHERNKAGSNIISMNNECNNTKNIVRNDNGESLAGNMGQAISGMHKVGGKSCSLTNTAEQNNGRGKILGQSGPREEKPEQDCPSTFGHDNLKRPNGQLYIADMDMADETGSEDEVAIEQNNVMMENVRSWPAKESHATYDERSDIADIDGIPGLCREIGVDSDNHFQSRSGNVTYGVPKTVIAQSNEQHICMVPTQSQIHEIFKDVHIRQKTHRAEAGTGRADQTGIFLKEQTTGQSNSVFMNAAANGMQSELRPSCNSALKEIPGSSFSVHSPTRNLCSVEGFNVISPMVLADKQTDFLTPHWSQSSIDQNSSSSVTKTKNLDTLNFHSRDPLPLNEQANMVESRDPLPINEQANMVAIEVENPNRASSFRMSSLDSFVRVKANRVGTFKIGTDKDFSDIAGLAVTCDGRIILCDFNSEVVHMLSVGRDWMWTLNLHENPWGVTVYDDTTAIATGACKLFFIDISGCNLQLKKTVELSFNPCAITLCDRNLLVTCLGDPYSIKLITVSGKIKWSVSRVTQGEKIFASILRITCYRHEDQCRVAVTNCKTETITILDGDTGAVIKVCKEGLEGKWPSSITTDNNGNIYICYTMTGEIAIWNREMTTSKVVIKTDRDVIGIAFDSSRNQLVVAGSYTGQIDTYQFVHS